MIGQVQDRFFVSFSLISNKELVHQQFIGHSYLKIPRITLLSIRTHIGKLQSRTFITGDYFSVPQYVIKPHDPSVKGIDPVVGIQLISDPVQRKLSLGNPVAIPADQCAEIGVTCQVLLQVIKSQGDITRFPIFIWSMDFCNNSTIIGNLDHNITLILQRIQHHGISLGHKSEKGFIHFAFRILLLVDGLFLLCRITPGKYQEKCHNQ